MPHGINKLFLLISRMVASFYFLRIVNVCYSCFVFALKVNKSKYFLSLFFWSLNFPRNCKEATILIHWEKVFLFCKLTKKKTLKISFSYFSESSVEIGNTRKIICLSKWNIQTMWNFNILGTFQVSQVHRVCSSCIPLANFGRKIELQALNARII